MTARFQMHSPSRSTGRSPETIRYTLKQFDQDHPDLAIFPDNQGPLGLETKRTICQQYQRGESVDALAKRFNRPFMEITLFSSMEATSPVSSQPPSKGTMTPGFSALI